MLLDLQKSIKRSSPAGNRTRVFRVTGGDTDHYTTEDLLCVDAIFISLSDVSLILSVHLLHCRRSTFWHLAASSVQKLRKYFDKQIVLDSPGKPRMCFQKNRNH